MDCLADNPGELSQSVSGDAIFVKLQKKNYFIIKNLVDTPVNVSSASIHCWFHLLR